MAKKTKAKRAPLTRKRILKAAVKLADKSGVDSLSMRKLASTLSVEAMSLYNHIEGKEDLLDGITDLVVGEIAAPQVSGDWMQAMRDRACSAHEVLLSHPWASLLVASRVNVGPSMLHYVDATVGCLVQAGFSYEMADRAWNAMDSHIYGFTMQELNFPFDVPEYAGAAKEFMPMIPVEKYPHLHALAQMVVAGDHYGAQDFNFGLELILGALERLRDV